MNGTLNVDTGKLSGTADRFEEIGDQVLDIMNQRMIVKVQELGNVWSGDARDRYMQKVTDIGDDMTRIVRMIREHVADLREMAASYERAEEENEETINGLIDDIIH